MGRTIFPYRDRIVGEEIEDAKLLQGSHADGGLQVIGKDEEAGRIREQASVESNSVAASGHGEFADAPMDVASFGGLRSEHGFSLEIGLGRSGDVCRTTKGVGKSVVENLEAFAGASTGGFGRGKLGLWELNVRIITREGLLETLHFFGVEGFGGLESFVELGVGFLSTGNELVTGFLVDFRRNGEFGIGIAVNGFRVGAVFFTQGFPMGFVGSLVLRAIANRGMDDEELGVSFRGFGFSQGFADGFDVIAIFHFEDVPFAGEEAEFDVLAERIVGRTIEGGPVRVVDQNEAVEAMMASQGNGFLADAFFKAAIAAEAIRVMTKGSF